MYLNKLQDKTNPQGKFNNIMLFIFFTKPKLLNIFCWALMYNYICVFEYVRFKSECMYWTTLMFT